jgi:nitrite reductase/ring-hydroxylating ferredoxin subunit
MRLVCIFLATLVLLACSNDRGDRNPYLPEIGFRFDINLNLPLYSPLTTTGNAVFVGTQGLGVRGVFVMNTGFNMYRAFEASCPNHPPSSCSTMDLNGQTAVCACEEYEYSLFTGQLLSKPEDGNRIFNMLEYRASQNGNTVVISN